MRIAYDIRPLQQPRPSGVGHFTARLLEALVAETDHEFVLFGNAAGGVRPSLPLPASPRVRTAFSAYPNKLLNAGFRFFGAPKLERLLSAKADAVFLPNPDFVATSLPLVATSHDLSFLHHPECFSPKQRLWHAAVDPVGLWRRAAGVIAVSQHTRDDLMETAGIPPERIAVAPLAVDAGFSPPSAEDLLAVRRAYSLPERFFLSLGTMEPRKNLPGLLDAFSRMPDDCHLVIAGGRGWRADALLRRIAASADRPRIRVLDYVRDADRPALLGSSLAFVYPSFYEGFGLPPLEAMACGAPVIASRSASLAEVIDDAGILVDPRNPQELADAMAAVLGDERLRMRLHAAGLVRSAQFSWSETARTVARQLEAATKSAPI